jgi:cytochrome P450
MTDLIPRPLPLGHRHHLFDPSPELAELPAISPLLFANGATGWVVTSPQLGRALLADPRFSADRTLAESPLPGFKSKPRPGDERRRAGAFITMDPPEHTRYRRLLTGQFTVRRMKQLAPRIGQIVDEHLDLLAQQDKPADLVAHFALPVPSLVICELVGVDYDDRDEFQSFAKSAVNTTIPEQDRFAARVKVSAFLRHLVAAKRTAPDNALLSGLIAESDLTDDELTNICLLMLFAGHETTANMLGLGTFALLRHPAQMAALRADPDLMPGAVEELMRYLSIIGPGIFRVATEDLVLGDAEIQAGQTVVLATPTANRSGELTDRPDELDVSRERTHHLAFGHGIHQCLGQQLARIEMQVGFRRLLERFPDLALAIPADQVPLRTDMAIYGVHTLPVTW